MNKLNKNNLLIAGGIIIAFVMVFLSSISSQARAHGDDDNYIESGEYGSHCMGANLSREEFTEFHEEMWDLMNKYGMFNDDNESMDQSRLDNRGSMMNGFNIMGMGSMMN